MKRSLNNIEQLMGAIIRLDSVLKQPLTVGTRDGHPELLDERMVVIALDKVTTAVAACREELEKLTGIVVSANPQLREQITKMIS